MTATKIKLKDVSNDDTDHHYFAPTATAEGSSRYDYPDAETAAKHVTNTSTGATSDRLLWCASNSAHASYATNARKYATDATNVRRLI